MMILVSWRRRHLNFNDVDVISVNITFKRLSNDILTVIRYFTVEWTTNKVQDYFCSHTFRFVELLLHIKVPNSESKIRKDVDEKKKKKSKQKRTLLNVLVLCQASSEINMQRSTWTKIFLAKSLLLLNKNLPSAAWPRGYTRRFYDDIDRMILL